MPFGIGATELIILLIVVLVVFGPKRLPEMGRSLGRGMREFKDSISGITGNDNDNEPDRAQTPGPQQTANQLPVGTQDTTATSEPQRETQHIS